MISIFTGAYFFGDLRTGGPRLPLKLCDVFGRLLYSLLLPLPAVLGFGRRLAAEADLDGEFPFEGDAYLEPLCLTAVFCLVLSPPLLGPVRCPTSLHLPADWL